MNNSSIDECSRLLSFDFSFQMSFSGRLGSSSSSTNVDSVVPLSISSTSSWDLLWTHDSTSSTKNNVESSTKNNVESSTNIRRPRPTHQAGLAEELVRWSSNFKLPFNFNFQFVTQSRNMNYVLILERGHCLISFKIEMEEYELGIVPICTQK